MSDTKTCGTHRLTPGSERQLRAEQFATTAPPAGCTEQFAAVGHVRELGTEPRPDVEGPEPKSAVELEHVARKLTAEVNALTESLGDARAQLDCWEEWADDQDMSPPRRPWSTLDTAVVMLGSVAIAAIGLVALLTGRG